MRLVRITWIDSCTNGGWKHDDEIDKWVETAPMQVETLGYLVRDDLGFLVIASSIIRGKEQQYSCLSVIPRSAVTKVEDIHDDGQR